MTSRMIHFASTRGATAGLALALVLAIVESSCQRRTAPVYDILILGGEVYDGSGGAPLKTDVAISGDKINLRNDKIFGFSPKVLTIFKIFAKITPLEYFKCHLFPKPVPVVPPRLS